MKKVLYITANPKSEQDSFSLTVGRAFIDAYKKEKPEDEIVELDVYKTEIPFIDSDVMSAWGKLQQGIAYEALSSVEQQKVAKIDALTNQFIAADKYVFVTPLWNLSIPPLMKAYFDTVCIAGKTFKYTENGPVGLMAGKKAVHIQARGGIYSDTPASELELGDEYVKTISGFLGIEILDTIAVEGMAYMPEKAEEIKNKALKHALKAAKEFANA